MKIKRFLSNIFWFPISSKRKIEIHQESIRQLEWDAIKHFIPSGSSFLDVGCGAGYSLMKAENELGCKVQGIDPEPGAHGVGRYTTDLWKERPIIKGSAEKLPFEDASFDVVYSSHVLEHVYSEEIALREMRRVLKPNGVVIIGVPTAYMSLVALISSWFFTTHISMYYFLRSIGGKDMLTRLVQVFLPCSHSFPRAKYVLYDLVHYRVSNWLKTVRSKFIVKKIITPGLYPYPDYLQWFPLIRKFKLSSSVFFICGKE